MAAEQVGLFLFGPPYAELDGEPARIAERKSLALLAYLALEGQQTRETLTALLWPDLDRTRARANLRYCLWSIRKTLSDSVLAVDGESVALAPDVWVDVVAFYAALSHRAGWEEAVRLSRGDFMQGFTLADSGAFDEWQLFQTEALRRHLDRFLAGLVADCMDRAEFEAALGHARRRLTHDPLSEESHRALMEIYARTGQRSAALRQFELCTALLERELQVQPDAATTRLLQDIRDGRYSTEVRVYPVEPHSDKPKAKRPDPPQVIVGRETTFAQLTERLADPSVRVLTLTGPGGAGKSTVALKAAQRYAESYREGAAVALLAETPAYADVPATILRDLGQECVVEPSPETQLIAFLADKQLLLILDNYEHLLPETGLVRAIVHRCPHVTLLITSRERLGISDESLLPLGGLACSANGPNPVLLQSSPDICDAERLFLIAARRLQPDFRMDEQTLSDVARICHLVDGLPLAIEMAAAWIRVLPVAKIVQEIEQSEQLLVSSSRDAPARHNSMDVVFERSWTLLSQRERIHLCRLAVFRNGFTGDAAVDVADVSAPDLLRLIDSSWVRLTNSGRYSMHRLARQYVERKAEDAYVQETGAPYDSVRMRHARYFASKQGREQAGQPIRAGCDIGSEEVSADFANFLAGFRFALESGDWTSAGALADAHRLAAFIWWSPEIDSQMDFAISALQDGLLSGDDLDAETFAAAALALAKVLCTKAEMLNYIGESRRAIALLNRSRTLLVQHLPHAGASQAFFLYVTSVLGYTRYYLGEYPVARRYLDEALAGTAAVNGHGDPVNTATAIRTKVYLTLVLDRIGEYQEARRLLFELLETAPEFLAGYRITCRRILARLLANLGDLDEAWRILVDLLSEPGSRWPAHGLLAMGGIARCRGLPQEANALLTEGLDLARATMDRPAETDLLAELGMTSLRENQLEQSRTYYVQSLQIAQKIGRTRTEALAQIGLGRIAVACRVPGQAADHFRRAIASTRKMGALPDVLHTLLGIAELDLAEERVERAGRLLQVIDMHSATAHEIRQAARALPTADKFETYQPDSGMSLDDLLDELEYSLEARPAAG